MYRGESTPEGADESPPDLAERWRGRARARGLATAITPLLLGLGLTGSLGLALAGSLGLALASSGCIGADDASSAAAAPGSDTLFLVASPRGDAAPDDPDPRPEARPRALDDSETRVRPRDPETEGTAAFSGILERRRERDPSWPDSVGRLLPRRYDDPERVTIENYFLYLPPAFGMDEDREWPVLLYLHGRSLRGDDLALVKRYGIPSLIERGYQFPFIIVSPQLPDMQHWVDVERMWDLLDEEVLEEYPVDDERVYVTGFSMGAGGTWRFVYRYADEVAAAILISATTPRPTEAWAEALEGLPMLVYHGDADAFVPYESAVEMVDFLRERGLPIELITLEGEGHGIVQDVYRDPDLYQWLLAHER